MIKVKDIAKECKVSVATVSKALNGTNELKQSTIDAIRLKAKEMGYVPNASARMLRSKRSYTIGILFVDKTFSGLKHEYFSSILDSIRVEAEKHGYDITFMATDNVEGKNYVSHAMYRNFDGVVIASVDFKSENVVQLVESGLPVVVIDYVFNGCTSIMSDNYQGLEKLTDFAIANGQRKIAFIHGEKTDVTSKRLAGFYRSMNKNKITINQDYIKDGVYHDARVSSHLTEELLNLPDRPTCIIYPDDISLIGGMNQIEKKGLKIPEDISVIGYDGVNVSRVLRPMLTTYIQNTDEIGRLTALKLIERIENKTSFVPEQVIVEGKLQEGGTLKKAFKA